ncbi:MAG: leucine-rich repeat protein [Eubacteriales bacterium]|nr:leucine-rich repeat protein [Eubacteriales bacterium]
MIDRKKAMELTGSVVIPDSMNVIRFWLFRGNVAITSVIIPGSIKRIEDEAFWGCKNLENIILNEGIEEIGSNVFTGCCKLRKVVYPDSVKIYQGRTFNGTNLEAPVLNVSGTILIFCPGTVSGKEWTVPDTVKSISRLAFIENQELELLHLPEGLERIEERAFIECGIREITIPNSVREIGEEAFRSCKQLEKVTFLNPETRIGFGAFADLKNLKVINCAALNDSDKHFHMFGQPFLIQHLEDPANLNHREDPAFARLTAGCNTGDAGAMYSFAEWFEKWSHKPGASPFYIRAANYWRYRAYCKGDRKAAEWFDLFFREHPGEHLESVLFEYSNHRKGCYSHSVPGRIMNDLGYAFFDPGRDYEIEQYEGKDLVTVSAFEYYESPDEDGFGAEYNYAWWFLDENMQPIPGLKRVIATVGERNQSFFTDVRDQAIQILKQRKSIHASASHASSYTKGS